MKSNRIRLTVLALLCGLSLSIADSPRTLSYQGVLNNSHGNPEPDGTYAITSRLYNAAQGGIPLWSETQQLGTTRGPFSAVLGEITPSPDSLAFGSQYWLGVTVAPDGEMTPRIQLTATGYSIHARTSTVAESVPDNSIGEGKITAGQVVKSLNGLHDDITIAGGGGTTVSSDGTTVTITSSGSGGTGIQGVQNTDNTMTITNPSGPTATINLKSPLSLSGKVGIGTATPGMSLEVTTPSCFGMPALGASSGNDYAYLHVSSVSDHSPVWNNARAMRFGTVTGRAAGYVEHMRINPDGNVGIGNPTPGARLTVSVGENAIESYGDKVGVWAQSNNPYGTGVIGWNDYSTGLAGGFHGPVTMIGGLTVSGWITKSGGSFKIDHPLDPANKYLSHSFVESPDMKNIYDGVVTLDDKGEASVDLPEWFQALNKDFRYQLIAIGQPQPALYVKEEIADNKFRIAGGAPGGKVSWLVTGIRHDPYANSHPLHIEELKPPAERGYYIHPELFGFGEEHSISVLRFPRRRTNTTGPQNK